MAASSNGDVVVVGNQVTFTQNGTLSVPGLARLTPSAQLDTGFGNGGVIVNSVPGGLSAVAVQLLTTKLLLSAQPNNNELTISRYLAR